jgi:hypothetical protein
MRSLIRMFVLTLLVSVLGLAQKPVETRSLSGLKAVDVLIEKLDRDIEHAGLSREQLKTDIELRLRKAGITLLADLPEVDWQKVPNSTDKKEWDKFLTAAMALGDARRQRATLYLNVESLKEEDFYIYHIELDVQQDAVLERDKEIYAPGTATWDRAVLGMAGKAHDVPLYLRQRVATLVDEFINDYLSVNPVGFK